uniref:acid phosphatase n=1 Tax=Timema bartmani TaxID=61472 RepID=A0A7R9EYE9_9NEOP|nr:unnamed protein product [Timema bartmani]
MVFIKVVALLVGLSGLQICCGSDDLESWGKLVLANVIYRHGARAPVTSYPNDPYLDQSVYWPRGYGQLTQLGEQMHYELGSFYRQRYSSLLPLEYNVNDTYIRSTDVDRTLMSAQSNLAGLYPALDEETTDKIFWQDIPIHTVDEDNDQLLQSSYSCSRYTYEAALVTSSKEYLCVEEKNAAMKEYVANYSGSSAALVYDVIKAEYEHGLTLPDWTSEVFPEPLSSYASFEMLSSLAGTKELEKILTGKFFEELSTNLQAKVNSTLSPDRSLFMYSAHDINLLNLLHTLKVWNGKIPPFASSILFELRLNSLNQYVVTVSYRNSSSEDPHLLNLTGCSSPACPIDEFITILNNIIPEDYDTECAVVPSSDQTIEFIIPKEGIPEEWHDCFNEPASADSSQFLSINYNYGA